MQNRKKPKAEKMPEKVFLTVGRHGRYSYGARLPLSESSILEGVYRGQELTAAYGSFDAVYSSDIPRAKATANLRAVGGDYARDKIVYSPELTEDSSLGSVSLFLDILAAEASLNGFRHVHLVTHAPVIEKIFSLLSPAMCFVPPDGGFTGEIESWEDLRGRKVNFIPWPDYYPGFSLLLDL